MEGNQVVKELTREQQIEAYEAEHKRRMLNVEEFKRQLLTLRLSLSVMDQEKGREIERTLDSLPNTSAKGMVDKILQLPMEKRTQLHENIIKMGLAVENETRRAGEAMKKKKMLQQQIFFEEVDAHTREVYETFQAWLDSVKNSRNVFYNQLLPIIQAGYGLSADFYKRAEKLGLSKSVMVSIESHFRHGEKTSMTDAISKIENLSDSYGTALLEKDFFDGSWPEDSSGHFFSEI